ncbi:hypothetical protein LC612_43355 [Nostoc sp. CHAB 5834]|nr:hypothetical protein [Nostoc sp. CHAB 5834]
MNLNNEENKHGRLVDSYVRTFASVRPTEDKQFWKATITVLVDIEEFGSTADDCLDKLVDRVWAYKDARDHILKKVS